jgi:molybdenum cofactor cytidylyltransferase
MRRVGALILAAGGSTRLGEPKQFLRFEDETLLHRSARVANEAGCTPIVVVAGDSATRVQAELYDLPVEIVQNTEWQGGIGTSIKRGVAHLRCAVSDIVILACDQPFVSADIIRQLCDTHHPIAASRYGDTVGIPARFNMHFFDELASLPDDSGAKSLIEAHAAKVALLPFPGGLADVDTRSDYEALTQPPSRREGGKNSSPGWSS